MYKALSNPLTICLSLCEQNRVCFDFKICSKKEAVADEDKSNDKQDLSESKEIDSENQLFHEQNITQTDFPDDTVITFRWL